MVDNYLCSCCKISFSIDSNTNIKIISCPYCRSTKLTRKNSSSYKEVKFLKLTENAIPFSYHNKDYDDACMDIYAPEDTTLWYGATKIIKTGIAVEIPSGYEGRVIGRSGLSSNGIFVHHGVIDEQYRGEIGVIITNLQYSESCFKPNYKIKKGDRIAQFSIHKVHRITFTETNELPDSIRKNNGFGSSGL